MTIPTIDPRKTGGPSLRRAIFERPNRTTFCARSFLRGRVSMLREPLRSDRKRSCCVPFPWHDRLYRAARQRCDVPWPHCHDARRLKGVRLLPYTFSLSGIPIFGNLVCTLTIAAKAKHPRNNLPPVAFHQNITAIAADVMMRHPFVMPSRRFFPSSTLPLIGVTVPTVITADPYVVAARRRRTLLHQNARRSDANHYIGCRCAHCQQSRED